MGWGVSYNHEGVNIEAGWVNCNQDRGWGKCIKAWGLIGKIIIL